MAHKKLFYLPIILILSLVKLGIQLVGNRNYGFHRDELLHLSVSEHLQWGFMEFPPLIGLIGKVAYLLFGYSLTGVRLFPTLAGVAILILCCLIAREMGGKRPAVILAGVCILAFLPFYRNHTLFQPVAFDQLFWTLGFYLMVRFLNTRGKVFLLLLGITLGLGLLNKYTMLVWALGVLAGLLFYRRGSLFTNRWLYLSGLLTLLIILPNIIWQVQHDFPVWRHLQALQTKQLEGRDSFAFVREQLDLPFTLLISLVGVVALLRGPYRPIGVAAVIIFGTMWALQAKAYYVYALYPVLFAAGAVAIGERLSRRPVWVYAAAALTLLPSVYFIPYLTPLLPIEQFVAYAKLESQDGRVELTGDYADMFGWEEQVQLVDSVYQSLSAAERSNCVLWAENYGEAGALKILGKKYDLPNPISRHGSFWLWGYGNPEAAVWISLGNERPAVEHVFAEVELIKIITHPYAIGEENGIPLYLCRNPQVDIPTWWQDYEGHVFD